MLRGAHTNCTVCGKGSLKGIEKVVGVCFACNRLQYQKPLPDDSPNFNFSDDDDSRPAPRKRRR